MTSTLPLDAVRGWTTDPVVRAAHRLDRSGFDPGSAPDAVVHAESVEDVVAVLAHAQATRTPVVVRGAGSGLSGGAVAGEGSIVLDLTRLNRITELSAADELAVVEPGVITVDLDAAAAAHGLRYAPDPASAAISTIGGNIATNAGGLRCAKYGVTRDSVLGLDVVLADGRRIRTGRRTVKGVAGYDLTGLFVGSEGTLGVIVGATVRLRPIPVRTATLAAWFTDFGAAAAATAALTAARLQPAVAELLDAACLEALGADGADSGAFLLVQTDGFGADAEIEAVRAVVEPFAVRVDLAADEAEAEALLATRRGALPALEKLGRVLVEDVAVPRSRLPEAVAAITEISRRSGLRIATMAHAGDGNLHPILVVDGDLDDRVWATAGEVFQTALDLGGTLTGEHGVGLLKRRWLRAELGDTAHDLQRELKAALDPHGLLNPGKAL
ncbi:FAD-binding oxidoreductase [Pseudonocardia sp. WMMC193]|uniref:FAD-binding oxidoreductase n=1 Tax=Pseudonocardia sp. WMMC193 TaxID=2911965 RepID=UPI001F1D54DB|nr:FAD-linked oxidase C-terminal domain-containing protein [Pseudonocardia sp. WMMC193]MCF7547981.1 FAD-binding protein [Pseudonocardia sp. WMMC193]